MSKERVGLLSMVVDPELVDSLRGHTDKRVLEIINSVLNTLTYREREIIKLRYGLGDEYTYTLKEVGRIFKVSGTRIGQIEAKAIRKLQHPVRARKLQESLQQYFAELQRPDHDIDLKDVVSTVKELTPCLIKHLQSHHADITKIRPDVFEELVAEFFASWGFDEVRLVGRDARTSADILVVKKEAAAGSRIRYFIEVKRQCKRIGVGVIDRVLGAIIQERPSWGWHLGMIVSTSGFCSFKKYTRNDLEQRGILLKDKDDIVRWLKDYRPSDRGLWLPPDCRIYEAPPKTSAGSSKGGGGTGDLLGKREKKGFEKCD